MCLSSSLQDTDKGLGAFRTHHITKTMTASNLHENSVLHLVSHTITFLEQKNPPYLDTNLLTSESSLDSIIMLRSLTTADTFSLF